VHRLGRRLAAKRCKRPDDSHSSPFRWPAEQGYGDRLRAGVFGTDGCGAAPRANPQMTPGKTPFGRAVHAQQTSACIQRQVQALRALRSAPVLRRSGCRRGEKGRLKDLSSWQSNYRGDSVTFKCPDVTVPLGMVDSARASGSFRTLHAPSQQNAPTGLAAGTCWSRGLQLESRENFIRVCRDPVRHPVCGRYPL
jgi:hypothetical protein